MERVWLESRECYENETKGKVHKKKTQDQSGNNRLGIVLQRINLMWRGSKEVSGNTRPVRENKTQVYSQYHNLENRLL